MARAAWPLVSGRPVIQMELEMSDGQWTPRTLLADTGAGTLHSEFELMLDEDDCLLSGGRPFQPVRLRGAYTGTFPVYLVHVRVPTVGTDAYLRAVGVDAGPPGLDGIACFRFLSRFNYGNGGDPNAFGLDNP